MFSKEYNLDNFNIIKTIPKTTIKKYIFDIDDIIEALKEKYFNKNDIINFNVDIAPVNAEDSYGNRYSRIIIEATQTFNS